MKQAALIFLLAVSISVPGISCAANKKKDKEILNAEINACLTGFKVEKDEYSEPIFESQYQREKYIRDCYRGLGIKIIEKYYPESAAKKQIFTDYLKAGWKLYESMRGVESEGCPDSCTVFTSSYGAITRLDIYQDANADLKNVLLKYIENIDNSETKEDSDSGDQ